MAKCIRCGQELTTGDGIGSMCLSCQAQLKPNQSTYQFYQQGWICPKCGRVYSPTTIMCLYCGNPMVIQVSNIGG